MWEQASLPTATGTYRGDTGVWEGFQAALSRTVESQGLGFAFPASTHSPEAEDLAPAALVSKERQGAGGRHPHTRGVG